MGKEFMERPPFSNATAISLTLNGILRELMPVWPDNPHAHASNHRVTSGGFKNAPPACAGGIFF
jgi:hypothetical protein